MNAGGYELSTPNDTWKHRDAAYAAQKAERDSRSAQPDKAVKEAILAQYSGAVEESSDDEDSDGDEGDEVCSSYLLLKMLNQVEYHVNVTDAKFER